MYPAFAFGQLGSVPAHCDSELDKSGISWKNNTDEKLYFKIRKNSINNPGCAKDNLEMLWKRLLKKKKQTPTLIWIYI